jgi:WD repeat-containing protein 59
LRRAAYQVFTSGLASVRWNKHNGNLLASAHDIQVEIWDLRKSAPVTFITAHPTKIANIDWSPVAENELITCSADGTVKLWDVKLRTSPRAGVLC